MLTVQRLIEVRPAPAGQIEKRRMLDVRVLDDTRDRAPFRGHSVHPRGVAIDNRFAIRTPECPPELTREFRDLCGCASLHGDSDQVAPWGNSAPANRISDGLIIGRPEYLVHASGAGDGTALFLIEVSNP